MHGHGQMHMLCAMHNNDFDLPQEPYIAAQDENWLVAFKPRGMHSSASGKDAQNCLSTWLAGAFPDFCRVKGYSDTDYGLLHRLDRDTAGLLLFAKTQAFFDVYAGTENSKITKSYYFMSEPTLTGLLGSLPLLNHPAECSPEEWESLLAEGNLHAIIRFFPKSIASLFRAYGEGRARVSCGEPDLAAVSKKQWTPETYTTSIDTVRLSDSALFVHVHLNRGFRHQIRAHLAWFGLPLCGDSLYNPLCGKQSESGSLSLTAYALDFSDLNGSARHVELPDPLA